MGHEERPGSCRDRENPMNNRGWYLDLLPPPNPPGTFQGEMQVSDSILRNGRIIFTTLIPDADLCSAGGSSWLMEMDGLTGARLKESPFDINNDGQFNASDFVNITLADGTVVCGTIIRIAVGSGHRPMPWHPQRRRRRVQISLGFRTKPRYEQHPACRGKSGT